MYENLTVEQAVSVMLEYVPRITDTEEVSSTDALGRILAQDMKAAFDNPPFDRSPVDGYACRAEDTAGASKEAPVFLKVTEEIDAGDYSDRAVQPGEAVRIMTGAAIPPGCDCCIRQEDTDYGEENVAVYKEMKYQENYCFAGEDFKKGTVLLKKDTKTGFVESAVLAGMGLDKVTVYQRPRVTVFTTGDEVVEPGSSLRPGKIYNSNGTLLLARLTELGIPPVCVEAVCDDAAVMAERLKQAAGEADLIITTGAVSVGKKDIMHDAVRKTGGERIFWRVLLKPGMPTLFSVYDKTPVISLSGNPFGVAVTMEVLIRPVLEKMTGDSSLRLQYVKGILAEAFGKPIRGRRFLRAHYEAGKFYLPNGSHSNGVISSMVGCNCLIDARPENGNLTEGKEVEAVLL